MMFQGLMILHFFFFIEKHHGSLFLLTFYEDGVETI